VPNYLTTEGYSISKGNKDLINVLSIISDRPTIAE